jgi:hypothetical protein
MARVFYVLVLFLLAQSIGIAVHRDESPLSSCGLPKGKHKIILAVEDAVGRVNKRLLQFEIV